MKKLLFLAAVFTGIQLTSNAQNTRVGFTGGVVFANYNSKFDNENDKTKSKPGLTVGVMVDVPVSQNFSFQPAVNFVQKGGKEEETGEKVTIGVNCIEVPLNFLYNAPGNSGNFFIGAGPSLVFSISGKWKFDDGTTSLSEDITFGTGDDDLMKGLDLGANFQAGFCFPNGLLFSVNYNLGLSNLSPDESSDGTLKSSYFGIRLGYLLKGKGKK